MLIIIALAFAWRYIYIPHNMNTMYAKRRGGIEDKIDGIKQDSSTKKEVSKAAVKNEGINILKNGATNKNSGAVSESAWKRIGRERSMR